jgi:uncharacterized protein YlxW (UPF0749 family)
MWEFFNNILEAGGLSALFSCVVLLILWRHTKTAEKKQAEALKDSQAQAEKADKLQEQIISLYEKRVSDVTESKDAYEELVNNLDKSIDLLIKVFRKNGG